jgi:diguanylate cyclase
VQLTRDEGRRWRWAACACALFVGAFGLIVFFNPAGLRFTTWVDDLGTLMVATAAAVASALKARRVSGRQRTGWIWLTAAGVSWAIGEGIWSWYALVLSEPVPSPSLADLFYLLGSVPLAAVGILLLGSNRGELTRALRYALDGLIMVSALLFVSWSTALGVVYRVGGGSLLVRVVDLSYPVTDIVLTTAALAALSRTRGGRRRELGLIGAGVLAFAVADSAFTYLSYTNTYGNGNVFDTAYIAGYLLILLAALVPEGSRSEPANLHAVSVGQTLLPYVPLAFAVAIAVGKAVTGARFDALLVATGAVTVTLVLVRQWLTVVENARLGLRLEASMVDLRASEREMAHQASHDSLTGLANRVLFADRVDQALARQRRHGGVVAVMVCDLDEFKSVNDTLGHMIGDELLRVVAERLVACVRQEDTVARLGGDEFGVLLESLNRPDTSIEAATRLNRAVRPECIIGGNRVTTTVSIGVTLVADGSETADELLRDADVAMYEAKNAGRDRCCVYESRMLTDAFARLAVRSDLAQLLEHPEQLDTHYQPIVDIVTGEVVSVEVLARWSHPERGLLFPDAFIPQAEATGAIVALGALVLRSACAQLALWRRSGGRCPGVSVNMSARQLHDARLLDTVRSALEENDLPATCLTLEITESVLLRDFDVAVERLFALKDLGVKIAVDDFGTGYSSFEYLRRLPVDILKIDRAFTRDIESDVKSAVLVDLMNQLAHTFGLLSVVEGVETIGQMRTIQLLACDQAQGYLLAKPAPAVEILPLLEGNALSELASRARSSPVG